MCIWVGRGDPIGRDSEVFYVLSIQSRANWGGGGVLKGVTFEQKYQWWRFGKGGGSLFSKSSSGGGKL